MIGRTGLMGALIAMVLTPSAHAGYYTSIDMPEEMRWSRDFNKVFEQRLIDLGYIADDAIGAADSPIRQRYILVEAMGKDGTVRLKTWQQKLNYSAVLIRRGKAYEAKQILEPLSREESENFLVWAQLASANFLSGNADFRANAPDCMKQALSLWPESMEKMTEEQKQFLRKTMIDNDIYLEKFRVIEAYFLQLMRHRLREENRAKKMKAGPDAVDAIFLHDDKTTAVRFLNEAGNFEVGRIARAEKAKLPGDAVEIVQQLLIWMPTDQRLLWLLGEVSNASLMDYKEGKERSQMLRSTQRIFKKLDVWQNPPSFLPAVKERLAKLGPAVDALPEDNLIEVEKFLPKDDDTPPGTPFDWWRTLGVGFFTGLVVGMFAVWQLQEMRRRRQARAAAGG